MLSWISSSVGISMSWIAPLPQSPIGSTQARGAQLVAHAVLVMVEVAVALQQAEAARVVVGEARRHGPRRIVERPPDALARAGPHGEAVGIVHLGPPVDGGGLRRLGIPVHRGQRRDAEALDVLAQEQRGLDVHDHALGALQREAVGAGEARPVEQRVDDHRLGLGSRAVSNQNSVKSGNSSGFAVAGRRCAMPRADRPTWPSSPMARK